MARILLIGLGATTETALDSLIERFDVVGLVRPTDARDADADPVVRRARSANVPVHADASPQAVERLVADLRPDCVVISSYNRLLHPRVIAACPFVNVHYGPLPRYRGMATVNWAILNREPRTAITIHTLVERMDAGRIMFQQFEPIQTDDTVADVYERLNRLQRQHLGEAVSRVLAGEPGVAQDDEQATYVCNRMPHDGEIDWSRPTSEIYALVRALVAPFPGAFSYLRGRRLFIWRATPVENPPRYEGRIPGRVVAVSKAEGFVDVLTGDGILRLLEVQLEGAPRVPASTLIASVRTSLGLTTGDLLSRVQALEAQLAELTRMLAEAMKV